MSRLYHGVLIGSVISAITGSSCCLGPFLFSFFGKPFPVALITGTTFSNAAQILSVLLLITGIVLYRLKETGQSERKLALKILLASGLLDLLFIVSPKLIALLL